MASGFRYDGFQYVREETHTITEIYNDHIHHESHHQYEKFTFEDSIDDLEYESDDNICLENDTSSDFHSEVSTYEDFVDDSQHNYFDPEINAGYSESSGDHTSSNDDDEYSENSEDHNSSHSDSENSEDVANSEDHVSSHDDYEYSEDAANSENHVSSHDDPEYSENSEDYYSEDYYEYSEYSDYYYDDDD